VADLAGSGLNQFDRLIVNGDAQLDGTLQLQRLGGYNPAYLTPHTVLSALSRTGTFDLIEGIQVSPTKYLAVTYTPTSVLVTAALPGDADLNGTVNIADFAILASNFNTAGGWSGGNFNGDALVNIGDF
jgi:hypothetical protein